MKGRHMENLDPLDQGLDLYPDELVNARSRPGTSKKAFAPCTAQTRMTTL